MLIYYCAKCQKQNFHNVCESCGRALPNTASRYVWSDYRSPLADVVKVGMVLRIGLMAMALMMVVMFAMEMIMSDFQVMRFLTASGILPAAVELYFGAMALAMLVLALQGRENVQYVLDPKGVLKRTWISPSRLHCWARGIPYDKSAIQLNAQGEPFLMAHEEYLVWQDAKRYQLRPRAGRIKLYRPYPFLFMAMHIPREAYDGAAEMVAAKIKIKA